MNDEWNKKELDVKYVTTEDQLADIMTKPLAKPRLNYQSENGSIVMICCCCCLFTIIEEKGKYYSIPVVLFNFLYEFV